MSETLLRSSQQMTESWQKIVNTPDCLKIYNSLSKEAIDNLRASGKSRLVKKDKNIGIVVSYLQALNSYLRAAI